MTFTPCGGQGYAEAVTGLPINMRQVGCPVANGGASVNLELVVGEFYDQHCVGCEQRAPTGDVPNLATLMDEQKTKAAQARAAAEQRTRQAHAGWEQRVERRRSLRVGADPAMASALDDIGVLDADPAADFDVTARDGARRRLNALAERSAHIFTAPVIDVAVTLVVDHRVDDLLTPLRHVARHDADIAPRVLAAAMTALRRAPVPDAGRCLADLLPSAGTTDLDEKVIEALVRLAEPLQDHLTSPRTGGAGDASGLRAVADVAPERVAAVLESMLPQPVPPAGFILPPGSAAAPAPDAASRDSKRCASSSAITALAHTHPTLVAPLVRPLLLSLGVGNADRFDQQPISTAQQALATMLAFEVGDVADQVEAVGQGAGAEHRERLFGVLQRVERLIDPRDRWRTSRDPVIEPQRHRAIYDALLSKALTRAGGDWGDEVRTGAAQLIKGLADLHPEWARDQLPALLGAVLLLISSDEDRAAGTAGAALQTATSPSAAVLHHLERQSRRIALRSTGQRLLRAIECVARVDAAGVSAALIETIADERASQRGSAVAWWLLPVLGDLGQRHGQEPAVLHAILPVLHSYLVDADASLRGAALSAWAKIGASHPLPSSLADLLPALLTDRHIVVIDALLGASVNLEWSDADRYRLLRYAWEICHGVDAHQHTGTLKKAMDALSKLARTGSEDLRTGVDQLILDRAADLDGYDLEEALQRPWLPATTRTTAMAGLRLRQARDLRINDRFNNGDDDELCALLDCGPGLDGLPVDDLKAAAMELGPERPLGAAEFAEVAWRAARTADAAVIMTAVVAATPSTPAYRPRRAVIQLLAAAAAFDAAVADGPEQVDQVATALAQAADAVPGDDLQLAAQARTRITMRYLLFGRTVPAALTATAGGPGQDPAAAQRHRAQLLQKATADLKAFAPHNTATADYLRHFAGLTALACQLLELDAAELDADHTTVTARAQAVRRRAALLTDQVRERFDEQDPLAGPLLAALAHAATITDGSAVQATLAAWAALPLPISVTRGPRQVRISHQPAPADAPPAEVAVVLASIDDHLITGPQVLRQSWVYELRLDVQPGPWPDWAQVLEADLLSQFTPAEAETPTYSWQRPADLAQDTFSATGTLILRFGLSAGQPAPPFLVRLRWRGTKDGQPILEELDVAGHREIRCRPFDASTDFLTDFPVFDERLLALYERLREADYDDAHLQAFCRLFTAICRAGLRMTWSKQYKRGTYVTERKFHDDLYTQLQAEPELGGRLERGSPLALGFLDVRHDGITAELKVERKTPVSQATAPKYMGQPTQYAAADGARLSILCILDMSKKSSPIGVPENYLFTLQPALHGLDNLSGRKPRGTKRCQPGASGPRDAEHPDAVTRRGRLSRSRSQRTRRR
ncbi:hypothetical protein [Streptomyces sp. NPDC046197]|uniref:hypothetical protein n=1 Tax=Streptomyces sp. NPDC046197 TaxID=3154337 RepID=UPI0033E3036F